MTEKKTYWKNKKKADARETLRKEVFSLIQFLYKN